MDVWAGTRPTTLPCVTPTYAVTWLEKRKSRNNAMQSRDTERVEELLKISISAHERDQHEYRRDPDRAGGPWQL